MTDPKHTEPVEVTQADRDIADEYSRTFPELRLYEAFARHRTAAEAAFRAREDALRGLIGDAYETLKRIEQGADEALVAAAAKEACDKIDAALSPAAKGGDHG